MLVGGHDRGSELWYFDPGATARSIGRACGQGHPELTGTDPVLGANFVLAGRRALPGKTAIVFDTLGFARTARIGATGCVTYLDFAKPLFTVGAKTVDTGGSFRLSVPIPNDPAWLGVTGVCQAVVHPTTGPLGFALTNAVEIALGR